MFIFIYWSLRAGVLLVKLVRPSTRDHVSACLSDRARLVAGGCLMSTSMVMMRTDGHGDAQESGDWDQTGRIPR